MSQRLESPVYARVCASELISLAYKVLTMAHVAFTIKFTVAYFDRVRARRCDAAVSSER